MSLIKHGGWWCEFCIIMSGNQNNAMVWNWNVDKNACYLNETQDTCVDDHPEHESWGKTSLISISTFLTSVKNSTK